MLEIYSKHFKIVNYYYSKPPSIFKRVKVSHYVIVSIPT